MADLLKDWYNRETLTEFAKAVKNVNLPFLSENFVDDVLAEPWSDMEFMARGRKISTTLGKYLPDNYPDAIDVVKKIVTNYDGAIIFCLIDFVEVYGLDVAYWDITIDAMEFLTQYASAEFAVRPWIINYEERMMAQMQKWAESENEHVRRLSSEGCRPALPWGVALKKYKQDPSPILPILEKLKADPSAYVRKSVANNLNDISKTHPELVAKIAKEWYGKNELTNKVVKHGCRTLLKKANREVLAIFGFGDADGVDVSGFSINTDTVNIGDEFSFNFKVSVEDECKVRLEYAIDFVKANGKRSRKIFQISESVMKGKKSYEKKHSFADLSTRKHYPGLHSVTLIANGAECGTLDFTVNK
ncbi:MAG: DNA alkylation repair protein [Defluviitaleaceae bacterium]|nr:DNA alkylation repair protein [Defluviitaleaceae bacterium]